MTTPVLDRPAPTSAADAPDTAELRARFAPVFARIAAKQSPPKSRMRSGNRALNRRSMKSA